MPAAAPLSTGLRRAISLGLALCSAAALGAPAETAEQETQMAQSLHEFLVRPFELDKGLPLDPALRAAAGEISASHLARLDKLVPQWLAEERIRQTAKGKKLAPAEQYHAVYARLLNELALWQLEPGDADFERATLAVLKTSPTVCDVDGDSRFTDFARRMMRIQAMPAAQRNAALATERELLAHWGQARPVVPQWPDPLPQDAAMSLLRHDTTKGERLALPPTLAWTLLGKNKDYATMHRSEQCALQQWWLRENLRQGMEPAAALTVFRFGTLISARDRLTSLAAPPAAADRSGATGGKPGYPRLASQFLVTGSTRVVVNLDAAGKPQQARVVERKIKVEGLRDARAPAFENVFDTVSVEYALHGRGYDEYKGKEAVTFELVWTLDGARGTTDNNPKGASR